MRSIPVAHGRRGPGGQRNHPRFTHDRGIPWSCPASPRRTGTSTVSLIGGITFRGGKLAHEHIYWNEESVLVQIGLLDPAVLPGRGIQSPRKLLEPTLPSKG